MNKNKDSRGRKPYKHTMMQIPITHSPDTVKKLQSYIRIIVDLMEEGLSLNKSIEVAGKLYKD
jgi:hypothetical protein